MNGFPIIQFKNVFFLQIQLLNAARPPHFAPNGRSACEEGAPLHLADWFRPTPVALFATADWPQNESFAGGPGRNKGREPAAERGLPLCQPAGMGLSRGNCPHQPLQRVMPNGHLAAVLDAPNDEPAAGCDGG